MQRAELTPQERRFEIALRLFSLFFLALAVSYLIQGVQGPAQFPFVANSLAKDGLFAILCFIAAGDVRQNGWAALLVIGGHALIVFGLLFMLAFGDTRSIDGTLGDPLGIHFDDPTVVLLAWVGGASAVVAVLALLYRSAAKARYSLRYLSPHQHRTAMAMAEVLVIARTR